MVSSFRLSPCKIHIRNVGRAISQLPLLFCFCLCVVRYLRLSLRNQRLRFRLLLILFGSLFFCFGFSLFLIGVTLRRFPGKILL